MPKDLQAVMIQVSLVVNIIKSRPLRNRLFSQLCKAMDSEYECLLYHTEVRWLSKRKMLKRLVQLKTQVLSFMETQNKDFRFSFHDESWWLKVLFLFDLLDKLNNLSFIFLPYLSSIYEKANCMAMLWTVGLGVVISEVSGPPVFHIKAGASR